MFSKLCCSFVVNSLAILVTPLKTSTKLAQMSLRVSDPPNVGTRKSFSNHRRHPSQTCPPSHNIDDGACLGLMRFRFRMLNFLHRAKPQDSQGTSSLLKWCITFLLGKFILLVPLRADIPGSHDIIPVSSRGFYSTVNLVI